MIGGGNRGGHRVMSAGSDHPAQAQRPQRHARQPRRGRHDRPARVGLLWCDAVGHDADAVLGGSRLVGARVPLIVNVSGAIQGRPGRLRRAARPALRRGGRAAKAQRTLPIHQLADLVAGYQHKGDVLLRPRRP